MTSVQELSLTNIYVLVEDRLIKVYNLITHSFDGFHFLILVNSDGCARDGELDDEDSEEDDHVDEEEDLVVLERGQQTENSDKEEEDATGDDPAQQRQAGDDGSRLPVGRHPNQEERHGLWKRTSSNKWCAGIKCQMTTCATCAAKMVVLTT